MKELGAGRIRTLVTTSEKTGVSLKVLRKRRGIYSPLVIFQASIKRPLQKYVASANHPWDFKHTVVMNSHALTEQDHKTGLFRAIMQIQQDHQLYKTVGQNRVERHSNEILVLLPPVRHIAREREEFEYSVE